MIKTKSSARFLNDIVTVGFSNLIMIYFKNYFFSMYPRQKYIIWYKIDQTLLSGLQIKYAGINYGAKKYMTIQDT